MAPSLRPYQSADFAAIHKLDQICFPPGIAYTRFMLKYFLNLPVSDCLIAEHQHKIVGFILAETNPPLAHIITLDVDPAARRTGAGTLLLQALEQHFAFRGVHTVLIETAMDNAPGIAFWHHHGYRTEAVLKRYYLGRIDAYEMRKRLPAETSEPP